MGIRIPMREPLLIKVSGEDKPGVTTAITAILARYKINILDIGQSVIHRHLSLGILTDMPQSAESSPVLKDLLFQIHKLKLQVSFEPVDEDSYGQWVDQQGKGRYIVSLLTRKVTADQLSQVTAVATKHGLNIDQISRLSGRVHLDTVHNQAKACVEFSARGNPKDLAELRNEFLELSQSLDMDIAFQTDNMFRRNRRLVCFDMDSTLIETEVINELAKRAGVGEQVAAVTEAAMEGKMDFVESFKQRVALLKGLDEKVLKEVAESLPLTEGAENLVSNLKRAGYKTAILSGGFTYFGEFLKRKLGIDYVFANVLDIDNGKVTGKVVEPVVDGDRKADLLRLLAQQESISLEQVIAVGDGANDLPMLSAAGLGIAFKAKPLVKASAKQSISTLGLDGILYLLGFRDRDIG